MADTSIVSTAELEAISSASGFAVWELEQIVSDVNFRFLRDELRAGRLGQVVNPEQALAAPSVVGQEVQAAVEKATEVGALLSKGASTIGEKLRELGLSSVVLATAVGIIALVVMLRR